MFGVLVAGVRRRKLCLTNHLSLYHAVAPGLVNNNSVRLPHIGNEDFLINPADEEEQLEEEWVDCAGHQLVAQLVVMRELAFIFMDPYLRKIWDPRGQVRQKCFCQQANQAGEEDVN